VAKSTIEQWEVREEGTNRVLGTHSTSARPARGDLVELEGKRYKVEQVADIAVSDGKTQRGWLIVAP
jgi:hypothetical protein